MRKFVAVGVAVLAFVGAGAATVFVDSTVVESSRLTQSLALWAIALIAAAFAARFAHRLVQPTRTTEVLFNPGAGIMPPFLAGREQERALLSRCLSDLKRGTAPPSDVMLVGPRGNGKTVLLLWFADACRKAGVAVVQVAPSRVKTQQELRNALLPAGRLRRLLPARWSFVAVKVEWEASRTAEQAFMERLASRCRRKPRVVLVDEAHTLLGDVGQYLLNVSQDIRPKAPFLLVLAGTPGLPAHLRKMDASFWDRNRQLGIGRLSETATKEALQEPLGDSGTSIDAQALDSVVEHSQHYAYFIQIWGEELWAKCLATKKTHLTTADVDDLQDNVERRMIDYYSNRYQELEASGLLSAAKAVAAAFRGGMDVTATDQTIDKALATLEVSEAERLEVREKLSGLGYVWRPPGQKRPVVWSVGIPSLMKHVLEQAASVKDGDKSNTMAGCGCGDG